MIIFIFILRSFNWYSNIITNVCLQISINTCDFENYLNNKEFDIVYNFEENYSTNIINLIKMTDNICNVST